MFARFVDADKRSAPTHPMRAEQRRIRSGPFRCRAVLTAQWHGDRAHRCARSASQADAGAEESEFEDLVLGQLLEIGDFQNRHARFGEQIGVDHLPVLGIGRGRLLEAVIVSPDDHCARLGQELGALTVDSGRVRQIGGPVWPQAHAAGADEDDVSGAQFRALMLEAAAQVRLTDTVTRRQDVDRIECGDVEHHAARDDRRMLINTGLSPGAAAEMLVNGEAVEDATMIAEMVQGIDMGAVCVYIEMESPE
jgi:hypothetical protein